MLMLPELGRSGPSASRSTNSHEMRQPNYKLWSTPPPLNSSFSSPHLQPIPINPTCSPALCCLRFPSQPRPEASGSWSDPSRLG